MNIKKLFKRYFLAGLVVTVPLIGTYLILAFIIEWVDSLMMDMVPHRYRPDELIGIDIPGLGFIATIIIILMVGFLTRIYLGKKLIRLGDYIISKIPIGRAIYSSIKQFMETVLSGKKREFKGVVMVEYPRKDSWVMGFLTKSPAKFILDVDERRWVMVFIPTTPNPTSGFLVAVPEELTRPVDIGTEEAFKFIISAGFVQERIHRPLDADISETD